MSKLAGTGQFRIARAGRGDYASVCRLLSLLDDVHRERVPWLFRETNGPPRSRDEYAGLIAGPDSTVLLARSPQVVGVALVLVRSTPDFPVFVPTKFGLIDNLVVAPEFRRHGVGRALAAAAVEWSKKRGATWLELGVYEFNDEARRFYEKLGYTTLTRKLVKSF
jgi:ribosomal protein S18 acetylase RimI-like enzyme